LARQRSRGGLWLAVVVIAAGLSFGLFLLGRYTAGHATAENHQLAGVVSDKSIAVLPLLNESGDPHDEYFSDGLSEELIAALAQISGLKVIGRSSSFRFRDRNEEPKTIGEKLGVSTLLEGTVRKQGDRVRIVAELVNAADGIELWTRTFDRELKDIFAVQQEIARAVAESLRVTLLGSEEKSTQMATNSVEAHNAYLQAHFHRQRVTKQSITTFLADYRAKGYSIACASLVVGSQLDPARIANSHIRAHALEGQLFRSALEQALNSDGIRTAILLERDAYATAATQLKKSGDHLRQAIQNLGRSSEGPWRAEQKLAAVGAWLALGHTVALGAIKR
jgi:TolB-like protein